MYLPGIGKGALLDELADSLQRLLLARAGNLVLELVAHVEVIFDGAFTAACHEANFRQAGSQGLFYPVLHQRLVQDGQDFFWHGLGGGQEPGAVTGHGKKTLLDHAALHRVVVIVKVES